MTRDLDQELKRLQGAIHMRVRYIKRVRAARHEESPEESWVPTKPQGLFSWIWNWGRSKDT